MDRRRFLKLSGLSALTLAAPLVGRDGQADAAAFGGPYWVFVHAEGAWDPRFAFDPIAQGDQNRLYGSIGSVGEVRFADIPLDVAAFGLDTTLGYEAYLMSNRAFAEKHASRFTVLNGIDNATNNHEAGTRATWSGRLLGEYPALGALVAATHAADQPMAFISGGSYDVTDRLVPLARVGSPDVLGKIAAPNVIDPSAAELARYHSDETFARIRAAQVARLDALRGASTLPRERAAMEQFGQARVASTDLGRFAMPSDLTALPGYQLDDLERMMRGAQVAVAAFTSGVAAAATLPLGGFDTHGNHDRDHARQLAKLWFGLDYLISQAEAAGILGKLYIVVGSDFGRGPTYNDDAGNAGKDHWPVTSMLVSGPGIPGGRVIGSTDAGLAARPVDPATLAPSDGGVVLTPEIVHTALRRIAGVTDVASPYPLGADALPLFG